MKEEQKIERRRTTWNVINIKARDKQVSSHYVDAFRNLKQQDPLVEVYGKKCISVHSFRESELLEEDEMPSYQAL